LHKKKKDQSKVPGEASLACRSFLAKAALPSRRDKFQREALNSRRSLSSIHEVNNVSKQTK